MSTNGSGYLILHKQRVGDLALWWRANRSGYTVDLSQAGRYSKEEAQSIAHIRGEDYPVPELMIGNGLKVRPVVSVEDADNFIALKALQNNVSEAKP